MKAYCDKLIIPLIEYDVTNGSELLGTLECYLNHEMNLQDAAQAMYIHKNTLKYRLQKIQEILGVKLKDTTVIASIKLALKIRKILG